jgi:hypothetical protein
MRAGHSTTTGRSILYNTRYSVLVWGVALDRPFHRPEPGGRLLVKILLSSFGPPPYYRSPWTFHPRS